MPASNEKLLFNLPVTRHWLEQFTLLSFKHGTSYRDILESLSVLFNLKRSIGWVYEVIHHNSQKIGAMKPPDLSDISCSANDELFDHQVPLLTSVCTYSLYCPLLQKEQYRDEVTWAIHLMDLKEQGYQPSSVILDGLRSLQAGHRLALEGTTIVYDTFHMIQDLNELNQYIVNCLKSAKTKFDKINIRMTKAKAKGQGHKYSSKLRQAKLSVEKYMKLHETVSTLSSWMQHYILQMTGYDYDSRLMLITFIADLFCQIEAELPHKSRPIRITIQNNKKQLLGFVRLLEEEFEALALEHDCDVYWLWQICYLQRYDETSLKKHELSAKINSVLRHKFYSICQSVICIMNGIDKASSLVENFNGRVRKFIRNHRHVSQELLGFLRFTMNHTPFLRSRRPHREGKSPAEILFDHDHQHWLEILGYKLFKNTA